MESSNTVTKESSNSLKYAFYSEKGVKLGIMFQNT